MNQRIPGEWDHEIRTRKSRRNHAPKTRATKRPTYEMTVEDIAFFEEFDDVNSDEYEDVYA